MSEEYEKKIFDYIALLEKTNDELVNTLKQCVYILGQFETLADDPNQWKKMMDLFHETIQAGERVIEEKTFH